MDQRDIDSLHAETLALQLLLVAVCDTLVAFNPLMKTPLRISFDHVANKLEDRAIALGKAASPEHLVKSVRIVEELRSAIFGDQEKPHGIV